MFLRTHLMMNIQIKFYFNDSAAGELRDLQINIDRDSMEAMIAPLKVMEF